MTATVENKRVQVEVLKRPICPCEMLKSGLPGQITINGAVYQIEYNAVLPNVGEPVIYGYRLVSPQGNVYDLPVDMTTCDCLGHLRWSQERGTTCKHRRAIKRLRCERKIA